MTTSVDIDLTPPRDTLTAHEQRWLVENFERVKDIISVLDAALGVNGSFVSGGKTYTIVNGVITSIV